MLNSEEAVIKELEKQYKKALKDINEKVKLFESDIRQLEEAVNADGLDESAKAVLISQQRSKVYQKQYQQALQGQISGILDNLHGSEYATIEKYLKECYTDGYIGTMYDIAKQGIPVIMPIDQAAVVKAVLTDSQVSKGLYDALGANVRKLKKTITQEVSRGIATGLSYNDIARNISNASNAPLSRAKTIARTEGHRIQVSATADAQHVAKAKGADVVKQWDATLDGRTRDSHRMVDGEIRELDEKFSNGLMQPGDSAGGAEEVVNCRCALLTRARWALDEDELKTLEERAEFFGLDKTENFDDFKEKYLKAAEEPLEKSAESATMAVKSSVVKDAVESGTVSTVVNTNKQSRHIKGSPGYIEGRSYINGTLEDAQKLVDELSGTGEPILDSNGKWTNKERVQQESIIGVHVEQDTKKETETNKATIIYSKTGSHIVPRKEDDK